MRLTNEAMMHPKKIHLDTLMLMTGVTLEDQQLKAIRLTAVKLSTA